MATHDYVIANGTGAAVRSDLNDALAAIVSNNSSSSEPATTYAYQWWADTTNNLLKLRNSANNAWITLRELDGTLLMEDGSASTPGLSFASDTNTGFFSGGADKIGFATGGAERLEIGSSEVVFNDPSNDVDFRVESNSNTHMLFVDGGNNKVGIGTSSPSDILTVAGSDAFIKIDRSNGNPGIDFRFNGSTSNRGLIDVDSGGSLKFAAGGNTERARIDSSGRLLVGTSSTSATNGITVQATSATNGAILLSRLSAPTGDQPLGFVNFSDNGHVTAASISAVANGGTWTSGSSQPTALKFSTTADGASSPTERVRIDSSGRVGIGVTPSEIIDVIQSAQGDAATLRIRNSADSNASTNVEIVARQATRTGGRIVFGRENANSWSSAAGYASGFISFNPTNAGTDTERARLDSSGRLLIGVSSSYANANADDLQVGNNNSSTESGITLGSTAESTIRFADAGNAGAGIIAYTHSSDSMRFYTSATERMRIDNSGLLGVGVSSPVAQVQINSDKNAETNKHQGGNYHLLLKNDGDDNGEAIGLAFSITTNATAVGAAILHERVGGGSQGHLQFLTNGGSDTISERMRITSAGDILLGCTSTAGDGDPGVKVSDDANNPWLRIVGNQSVGSNFFLSGYNTNQTNNGYRFYVKFDGGIANFSGNNSNLSDEREKKNIVSLDSKWNKVKSWELKKFHYNDDADTDDLRYGVIAQQVEEHCPEVLADWVKQKAEDAVLDEDGNVVTPAVPEILRKGVKEQQMMWMAIKALQEAQARIETLETKVAALEAG